MDMIAFAKEWETGWNTHDLDRILGHYRKDIVFRSQKALALVGSGEVAGIKALREYWQRAIDVQPELRFEVQDVYQGHDMMVITYRNHRGVLAAEMLCFDADGLVYQAGACHVND